MNHVSICFVNIFITQRRKTKGRRRKEKTKDEKIALAKLNEMKIFAIYG